MASLFEQLAANETVKGAASAAGRSLFETVVARVGGVVPGTAPTLQEIANARSPSAAGQPPATAPTTNPITGVASNPWWKMPIVKIGAIVAVVVAVVVVMTKGGKRKGK